MKNAYLSRLTPHLTPPHSTTQHQRPYRGLREASTSKMFLRISKEGPFLQTPKLISTSQKLHKTKSKYFGTIFKFRVMQSTKIPNFFYKTGNSTLWGFWWARMASIQKVVKNEKLMSLGNPKVCLMQDPRIPNFDFFTYFIHIWNNASYSVSKYWSATHIAMK